MPADWMRGLTDEGIVGRLTEIDRQITRNRPTLPRKVQMEKERLLRLRDERDFYRDVEGLALSYEARNRAHIAEIVRREARYKPPEEMIAR